MPQRRKYQVAGNASGLCLCGCGRKTGIAGVTDTARGRVMGQPYFYVRGHAGRGKPGHPPANTRPLVIRFWDKVQKGDGCWLWIGGRDPLGYGRIRSQLPGQPYPYPNAAHRVSYFLAHGDLPPRGMDVRHKCDNPQCVNPEHLEPGTRKDNVRDAIERGDFLAVMTKNIRHAHRALQLKTKEERAAIGRKAWQTRLQRYGPRGQREVA